MASQFSQPSGAVATVATTAKTIVSIITGATLGVELIGVSFSSDGSVASGQYTVELVVYTTDGTGTAGTVVKYGSTQATVISTTKTNYTVEPTTPTVLDAWLVPATQPLVLFWPLGREIWVPPSKVLGLRVTNPSGTPNVRGTLVFEE